MKVMILAPSLARSGGIERYVGMLQRAFVDSEGAESVRVVALPDSGASNALKASAKLAYLTKVVTTAVVSRPDLILCAHVGFARAAQIAASLIRTRYWVIAHGIEVWGALPASKERALRSASRIVAVSEFTARRLVDRHGIPRARIAIVPGAFDASIPSSSRDAGPLSGGPVILTVSRLASVERYKGHDAVLAALPGVLEEFPDATYVVVGDGDDRPRLAGVAADAGVADNVRFMGRVSDQDLAAIYLQSSVFVLPAKTMLDDTDPKGEGFGIVFLEAMAFGLPVIGPRDGAPAEFIEHERHGLLVDPTSPSEITEAIKELLRSPSTARAMGEAGKQLVTTTYSFATFADRWTRLVDKLRPAGASR